MFFFIVYYPGFNADMCWHNMFNNLMNEYHSFLLSFTSPKRTEATRARVLVFHAGRSEITTTTPPPTCGCIAPIVATSTMEGNWSAHFLPSLRATPSPASWTWRLTPYHLQRMTRSGQIFTISVQRGFTLSDWCVDVQSLCVCFFFARSQSWHLKVWWPLNCTRVCCSTAVILERRYLIYCSYFIYWSSITVTKNIILEL